MRIISGKHRGRKIIAPSNMPVRPTTDQAKESLFNIIHNRFYYEDIEVLDLFSGTGNIAYEFCSRGAKKVLAVELNFKCSSFIKKTVETLNMANFEVIQSDVFRFLKHTDRKFDLIFADPPYDMEGISTIPDLVFSSNMLNKEGWLIIEHSKEINFSSSPNLCDHRNYGKVNFSFFCEK